MIFPPGPLFSQTQKHMQKRAAFALIVISLLAGSARVDAQHGALPQAAVPPSPRERMEAFHAVLRSEGGPLPESFFPSRGDWTWVETVHDASGTRVSVWRFPALETEAAMLGCGPVRRSFLYNPQRQPLGSLTTWALRHPRPWLLAGPNRFAPGGLWPDGPNGEPVAPAAFVEWRLEDGQWVISSFGDERFPAPQPPDSVYAQVLRAPAGPAPAEPAYAEPEPWYVGGRHLTYRRILYEPQGLPAAAADPLEAIGWVGQVRVYSTADVPTPNWLYVGVSSGLYQAYQRYTDGCL
ncbi:MAG TPA: hypothetical protein VF665_25465 [Longimicrobium sp.]|jgi:hypothetical protein|uniref:hypothetical protein n=1 Tax=Longimicrobium sp. TaxID=2029185 RepID=UPI002EDA13E6